jgi:hypothetical protein
MLAGHKKRWPAPLAGMPWSRRSWPVVCRVRRPQKTMACATCGNAVEQTFAVCRLPGSQATKNDGLRHFRECSGADDRDLSSAMLAGHEKRWPAHFRECSGADVRGVSSACSQATKNDGLRHFRECSGADVRGVSSAVLAGHKKRWPAPLSGMQSGRRSWCVVCQARRPQKRWACATFGNAVEQTFAVCRLPGSQATKNDGLRHFRECSGADDRDLSSAMLAGQKKRWPAPLSGMQWGRRS